MAITRAQIAKQLLANGGRIGFRGGDAARSDAASGRDAGRADPGGGVDRSAVGVGSQFARNRMEAALKEQRKKAIEEISPSTRPRNKVISGLLSVFGPRLAGYAFNRAVDQSAMGFNKPTIPVDEGSDDGGETQNNRELMLAQRFTPYQEDIVEEELSPIALALQQRGEARAFAKEGGIMNFEQARQGYKLGKLVKKIGRSLKKIGKSKAGKAALAAAAFIPFGDRRSLFTTLRESDLAANIGSFLPEDPKDRFALAAAAGLTAAPFIFGEDDTEDEYQKFLRSRGALGQGIDIQGIRNKPYDYLGRAFVAEGGKPEPVAKKTMPLLDMGGKEKDYRETGGFVDMGRMEKADDVPARLSKNEFVFTADAVRNAGDGDVDKGSEVMYNMMKNLEAGGEVSEESQGLEGARKMFQTSQRLEEVL